MPAVSTVRARDQFSEVINRAAYGKERVVLTRRGRSIAAVVPIEDVRLLEQLEDRLDLEEARKALREAEDGNAVNWEDLKADLGL